MATMSVESINLQKSDHASLNLGEFQMKCLIVGSGAREHALAVALSKSEHLTALCCFAQNRNPGIASLCQHFQLGAVTDADAIVAMATAYAIDCVVIGPEAPLASGVVDALQQAKISVIGPNQTLAQIESSKGYARDLIQRHQIGPSVRYRRFTGMQNPLSVSEYIQSMPQGYVIKADGLKGGKGVKVSGEHLVDLDAAMAYCRSLSGPFVIEERWEGQEFSLLSFSDGVSAAHMIPVQDHKRLGVGDVGPNTGGMGAYTMADHSLPFLTPEDIKMAQCMNQQVIEALYQETGMFYQGVLYGGFMKTVDGIRIIEYNARLGDPEGINLLALLDTDLVTIFEHILSQNLKDLHLSFKTQASVCQYLVPKGYPQSSVSAPIDISGVSNLDHLFYGAVDGATPMMMTGSRAIAVLGTGNTLADAHQQVSQTISQIKGQFFYRADIGTQQLVQARVDHMNRLFQGRRVPHESS